MVMEEVMSTKYYTVSAWQLIFISLLTCVLTVGLFEINSLVKEHFVLPEVHFTTRDNTCIKVVNYENGQAYNCNDVNVILRKYRKINIIE